MIVVDTNIIAYGFIEGEKTEQVLKAKQKDSDWIVPLLWRYEFLNVLSTVTRNGILNTVKSLEVWKNAFQILYRCERPVDMVRALSLSIEKTVSAYDTQYISLAESLDIKCLTEDKRLAQAFPQIALTLDQYLS